MGQHSQQPGESAPGEGMSSQQRDAILASLPDAILVWDQGGKILFLNAAALTLFEIPTSSAFVGTSIQQFFHHYTWLDEQQRPFFFASRLLDLILPKEAAASCSYEKNLMLALPSSRKVFLDLCCSPVAGADLQPIGMLAIFHKVPVRYQEAFHLQRVHEALLTFNEAITRLPVRLPLALPHTNLLLSHPVLLVSQQLVDLIREVIACWRVSFLALIPPAFHVKYIAGSGFISEQEQWRREMDGQFIQVTDFVDKTVLARLQANQEMIFPTNLIRFPTEMSAEFSTDKLLVMPLFVEQTLTGLLVIYKHGWDSEYPQEEIDLARVVATQAMLIISCLGFLQKQEGSQARELMLSEVNRLSKDLLALASHELRTPLTGIKGNLQLAQRRLEQLKRSLSHDSSGISEHIERTLQSLESAEQSTLLQERMVQDMIDDACIQANQLDLSLKPCDLLALIRVAVAKQQASVPTHTIELENLTTEPTISVLADIRRVTQVLAIYLTNALDYSPVERPVIVQVESVGNLARVSVHDEGPGIPPEDQKRLWDRLYRGKGSTVQHELDLSLGLSFYLCQALIERHHGSVGVESEPDHGTTFWFTLPMESAGGA